MRAETVILYAFVAALMAAAAVDSARRIPSRSPSIAWRVAIIAALALFWPVTACVVLFLAMTDRRS